MRSAEQSFEGRSLRRFVLSLFAALVMVLGLCPAIALAGEVEVEPEGAVEPVAVVQGEDVIAEEPVVTVQDGLVGEVKDYGLRVGGTQVTSDNAGNVFGDGKVSFTPAAGGGGTLTLNGYTFDGTQLSPECDRGIQYSGGGDLTIELKGSNSIKATVFGIAGRIDYDPSEGSNSIIITGSGSLIATGMGGGIRAQNITINGGTVTAIANGKENSGGISAPGGNVTIGAGINVKAGADEKNDVDVTGKAYESWDKSKWVQTTAIVAVTGVTVDPATVSIAVGDSKELKAIVTPDDAADKTVTWKSDDDDVAKVDANGKVTAVAVGRAYITATANDGSGKSGKCVVSVTPPPVTAPTVTAHVQRAGWMDSVADDGGAGTVGKSRRLEALTLKLPNSISGGIEYRCHLQKSGWEKTWKSDGQVSGTTGQSLRAEAFEIRLTGEAADIFDIRYRVHSQRLGWMGWAENGQPAGTTGMSRRAEAIQVVIVPKGSDAPGKTYNGVTQRYLQEYAKL
ncbi:MAG: Ig-like domain-containing protein [Coriobacteriales bacterium]|nr:Ig-like domain-containing protein [Coriobacteriales bacterium]